jgi:hypothetical protein
VPSTSGLAIMRKPRIIGNVKPVDRNESLRPRKTPTGHRDPSPTRTWSIGECDMAMLWNEISLKPEAGHFLVIRLRLYLSFWISWTSELALVPRGDA